MCGSGTDDHGNTFLCATPIALGVPIAGELANPWHDDEDVFELTVTVPRTLVLHTDGETDTFGRLENFQGDRLAADDDGGGDGNFRLVKTLMPGRYFLRIASARWSEGDYRLLVSALDERP